MSAPAEPTGTEEAAPASAATGPESETIARLRRIVERQPDHPEAWRVLADHLLANGDAAAADSAYLRHVQASAKNPGLKQAAVAMLRSFSASPKTESGACSKAWPSRVSDTATRRT